ncbi:glycosyltransferase family 2 protein [Trinickia soli]|uniref:glycosyltransferase family 2 protein n=1 Tax=Trinickia soli TaxID=380675 RepID=UPI00125892F5|nr:glycosyltransferase family 2 protein [Paraburkholderia sp. T12-10]
MPLFRFRQPSISSTKPTISVVIPLYNHAKYIEAALDSVLAQTSPADEIVLIDDGSSDDGFEIATRRLANVPNARAYRQQNAGAHNTINRAIGVCRSEYVAVLNSDDIFTPKKLERCRAIIQTQPSIGLISGMPAIMDDNGVRQGTGIAVEWLGRARQYLKETALPQLALLNENFVATTSNMVFRRELWAAAGGFQPLRYCHDLDFLMFAYSQSSVFLDGEHEHIVYRVHEKNTIKEDLSGVRVEIAAVIAQALFASGPRMFSAELGENDLAAFLKFLRNKQMTQLLCFFQAVLPAFPTRAAFYEYATKPYNASAFRTAAAN